VQNLFWRGGSASGSGLAVVRPEDLAVLRIGLAGMTVISGAAPRLRRAGTAPGRIILHFPLQSIGEQSFFEAEPPGYGEPADPYAHLNPPKPAQPGGSEAPTAPPVRARISGESRLVFDVPEGFDALWTLEGVLDAVRRLEPVLASNAKARQRPAGRKGDSPGTRPVAGGLACVSCSSPPPCCSLPRPAPTRRRRPTAFPSGLPTTRRLPRRVG
jgi:hypothetical protein